MNDPAPAIDPAAAAAPAAAEPVIEPAGTPDAPTIDKFETWSDLEAGYRELEAFRGNSIRIPTGEAGAEDWAEFNSKLDQVPGVVHLPAEGDTEGWQNFYQRLGAPAEPNGYEFSENPAIDPADDQAFAQMAHENGLTRQQASGLRDYLAGNVAETQTEMYNAQMAEVQALHNEYGGAFDHKMETARAVAHIVDAKLGTGSEISDYVRSIDPSQPFDTRLVKMLNYVAELTGEQPAIDAGGSRVAMTPEEAMLQASEIRDNPDHPYNNELDPAHESAKKKMTELYKIAYQR